jgi:hypothetical protein
MDEKNNSRVEGRTAWHPLLVLLIEQVAAALPPEVFELLARKAKKG